VFPIRDAQGQTIAFGGRSLDPNERAKYLNSPETPIYHKGSALFGIDQARTSIASASAVVIVEGYFDVLAAHAAGVRNVVASSGTALTSQQVTVLGRLAPAIVLCFDADPAGRLATARAVDLIAAAGLSARICLLPPGTKDPDDLVRSDPQAFAGVVDAAPSEWEVLLDWALADHQGEGTEDRRAGIAAAVDVLRRIPEASARALYAERVATRLRLPVSAIADDVRRQRRSARDGAAARPTVLASVPVRQDAAGRDDESDADDMPAWESYLAGVVVQRPAVAPRLTAAHGLDLSMVRSAAARRFIEQALALGPDESFPMHMLGDGDKRLAARLLLRMIPELADASPAASLDRALSQNVARVVRATRQEEVTGLDAELRRARDEGRDADVEALLRRKHELATEIHRLGAR
jgi:DNA primase